MGTTNPTDPATPDAPEGPPVRLDPRVADDGRSTTGFRVGVRESVLRKWKVVLAVPAVLIGLALILGLTRSPEYTAESRLNVGRIDVTAQAIPGFATGVVSLAGAYSRLVDAEDVVVPVATDLGVPTDEVAARVSASPIPESPLFRVEATGDSEAEAVALANATSQSLIDYINTVNSDATASDRLLRQFRSAANGQQAAEAAVRNTSGAASRNPTAENQRALARARAELETATLRADTLRNLYQQSREGVATSSNFVQVVNPAGGAVNDRGSTIQRLVATGLIGGLIGGIALAVALANRRPGRDD